MPSRRATPTAWSSSPTVASPTSSPPRHPMPCSTTCVDSATESTTTHEWSSAMFRLTIKNLLANKVRFALTTFGVILAVSFVVSAFVLGDGLRSTFTKVSEDVTAGVDLQVRGHADFGDSPPLPADIVSKVAAVPGVADAVADIESADSAIRPVMGGGGKIPVTGPPLLAFNWIDHQRL